MDLEQMAQEAAIWPWLDSDCMADPATEIEPADYWQDEDCDEDCGDD